MIFYGDAKVKSPIPPEDDKCEFFCWLPLLLHKKVDELHRLLFQY
jgi:hypothetical protein